MSPGEVILARAQVTDGKARGFQAKVKGKILHGLVVQRGETYFAYRNECKHLAITLDLNDEQFFNAEGTHLQCQLHGATYEIESGECIAGPCVGAFLEKLELRVEEDRLVIQLKEKS